jgi:hypothetical protein
LDWLAAGVLQREVGIGLANVPLSWREIVTDEIFHTLLFNKRQRKPQARHELVRDCHKHLGYLLVHYSWVMAQLWTVASTSWRTASQTLNCPQFAKLTPTYNYH